MKRYSDDIEARLTGRHRKCIEICGELRNKTMLNIGCYNGWFERAVLISCRDPYRIKESYQNMKFQNTIQNRLTGRHKKSFIFVGTDNIKNKDILDIGCSYGWFEKWAIENGCMSIIGLEPGEKDFENAKQEVPEAKYLKGSSLEIPLDDESVDIVVMWEVLEHLPKNNEEKAFREIKRVLRKHGELNISTPHKTFWSCILDPAWWLIRHRHYSLEQIKKIAQKTGFEIVKVEYGGGFWELHSMILLYIFKWLFRSEFPFKNWFENKREVEFLCENGWTNIFVNLRKAQWKVS